MAYGTDGFLSSPFSDISNGTQFVSRDDEWNGTTWRQKK